MAAPKAPPRYRLQGRIAEGAASRVFEGLDAATGDSVVLKQAKPHDEHALTRLADEFRLGTRAAHPHLVKTRDFVEVDGTLTLVVDRAPGVPLDEVLRRGPLATETVARIGVQIACALGALHGARDPRGRPLRAVHRDVCPGNVLFEEATGRATLLDLGLASALYSLAPAPDEVPGELRYRSPEALIAEQWSPASDFWALGMMLVELGAGRRALEGRDPAVSADILGCAFLHSPAFTALEPSLQAALRGFFEPEPVGRVRTAQEAHRRLAPLAGSAELPSPPADVDVDPMAIDIDVSDLGGNLVGHGGVHLGNPRGKERPPGVDVKARVRAYVAMLDTLADAARRAPTP